MTLFKNSLMSGESTVAHAGRRSAHGLEYQLPGGRTVRLEECSVSFSRLGFLAGREERIREKVVNELPELVRAQFPGNYGLIIKPVPEGRLPAYIFMAALACDQPVSDPSADCSRIVLCWLGNDVETPLPRLIDKEISDIEWDKHAVDVRT